MQTALVFHKTVHLWVVDWSQYLHKKEMFWQILSTQEKEKALKFLRVHDQDQFIIVRGLLRLLISNFIDSAPSDLHFQYNVHGKPTLLGEPLHFNLSHARHQVVYAICRAVPVGVDIEYQNENLPIAALAQRYFSHGDYHMLMDLDPCERVRVFFRMWVQKEAVIKALGRGLFSRIENSKIEMTQNAVCSHIVSKQGSGLLLHLLDMPNSFQGCLAVQTEDTSIIIEQHESATFFRKRLENLLA